MLVDSRAAAAELAISSRKLWQLTASGEVPHVRIGRAVRYSLDDLREWVRDNTEGRS